MDMNKPDQEKVPPRKEGQSLADWVVNDLGVEEISPEEYEAEAGQTRASFRVTPPERER